ncbi:SdpA family antimicrobial peptide system protein [Nonomuraea rubra]|uniref:SdpA family antimicrobial peptide system protein n=1 Tax=Nonomuraea rubra TaxID=46180 RepID=UPI0034013713
MSSSAPVTKNARLALILGTALATMVVLLVFLGSVQNALVPESSRQRFQPLRDLMPQGWAFFTKSPRGYTFKVMGLRDRTHVQISRKSQADAVWLFGANRMMRSEEYEIASMVKDSSSAGWTPCRVDDAEGCLVGIDRDDFAQAATIVNRVEAPRFCGSVTLLRKKPVPWAWAGKREAMPQEYRIVNVRCEPISRRANS